MYFPRTRVIRTLFQYSAHHYHSRVCCVPIFKQTNSRQVCSHSETTCVTNLCKSNRAFTLTKRLHSTEVDPLTLMPMNDPEKGDLVYGAPLGKMIKGVKMFSLSTSIIGLCLQPYLILHSEGHSLIAKLAVGTTVGFFVFITPLLIHWVTKKYVTDCYWNKDKNVFTAATISFLLRRKEIQFIPEDVIVPDIPGMFTSVVVKGRALFMDRNFFLSKEAYIQMMGYDRPIEWEIPADDNQSAQKSQKS